MESGFEEPGGSRTIWISEISVVWIWVTTVTVVIKVTAETAIPSKPVTVADMDAMDMGALAHACAQTAAARVNAVANEPFAAATAKASGMPATAHDHTMTTAAAKASATTKAAAVTAATAVRHRDCR